MDSRTRPAATIISVVFCVLFISIGWYYGMVRPLQLRAATAERAKMKLEKENQELKAKQIEDARKAEEERAAARAIVKVDTKPSHLQVTMGSVSKTAPATFEGIKPGKATLTINLDGYRTFSKELTLEGNQTYDLGLIEMVAKSGGVKLTSPQEGVTYSLTGPGTFSRSGTIPDTLDGLAEGTYTLSTLHKGWSLPAIMLTVADQKVVEQEIKYGYGSLTIQTTPPGATVFRNKLSLGQTPLTFNELRPGSYKYIIQKEGYRMATVQADVKESTKIPIDITLEKTRDFTNNSGIAMAWIPEGYWVGQYEITQTQYELVMGRGTNPSAFREPNHPVETVTWQQAMDFCKRLTEIERAAGKLPDGYKYSLPTEAQWNYFVADSDTKSAVLAYDPSVSPASTAAVGSSDPNRFGLYDVIGNVWEWCLDNFDADGHAHVMRGGGWLSTHETFPNIATRNGGLNAFSDKLTGFRIVLVK